jgi:hypothetical protein
VEEAMKTRGRVVVALVVGLALAGASLATAGRHQRKPRPFWGMTRGQVGWSLSERCLPYQPVLTGTEGKGWLTHLGRSAVAMTHCANDTGGAFDGRITLTAAHGDRLLATYTAQTVSVSDGLLVMQMSGVWVDGGTGRFVHASGNFTAMVYVYPGQEPPTVETLWPIDVVYAGMLAY